MCGWGAYSRVCERESLFVREGEETMAERGRRSSLPSRAPATSAVAPTAGRRTSFDQVVSTTLRVKRLSSFRSTASGGLAGTRAVVSGGKTAEEARHDEEAVSGFERVGGTNVTPCVPSLSPHALLSVTPLAPHMASHSCCCMLYSCRV
jgi:hypothetical protein